LTEAYRLCRLKYSPKSGDGAERNGGRWNPPGLPAVYSAAHPSLAILEVTIHFTPEDLPNDYGMTRLEIPTGLMLAVPDADLPHGWDAEEDDQHGPSQKFGRIRWLQNPQAKPVLSVPSSITGIEYPFERNLVLNPSHPQFTRIRFRETKPFSFDPRLVRRTGA